MKTIPMNYSELMRARRSVRKFDPAPLDAETLRPLLEEVLRYAPTGHNARSNRLLVVTDPAKIARMAAMRDSGAAFAASAPAMILVMGDRTRSDLWKENAAIAATMILEQLVAHGLAGCWVHVDGRRRVKADPASQPAEEYLREFLPIPAECSVLCAIACGRSDYQPKPLPEYDPAGDVLIDR